VTPELPSTSAVANRFYSELAEELTRLDPEGLLRRLRVVSSAGPVVEDAQGKSFLNFASNSYLALNEHPAMKQAAAAAIEKFGTGSGASLLVSGRQTVHESAERAFAQFKHAQAALLLPTGYMANLAAITALAGHGDLVCLDKLCHASLIDAARASGADVRTYPHLQTDKLQRLLSKHASGNACGLADDQQPPSDSLRPPRRFIVTDSVFSMDGDCADLPSLCDLAETFDAVMVVDEAHGTGLLGETGAGLCEAQGVTHRVHVTVSTASKALGSLGGIITADQVVIDTIVNKARPLIYTTAIPPAQAATIEQAIRLIQDEPWRRERVQELTLRLRDGLLAQGWELIPQGEHVIPIIPMLTRDPHKAVGLAKHLHAQGILAIPIRPPTVAPGVCRVRLSVRCDMKEEDIDRVIQAASQFGQ
jgi:8-amino-7-oxononanoate synthase